MSKNSLYLRKWQILVIPQGKSDPVLDISDSEIDKQAAQGFGALRVTFRIEKLGYEAINYGDIRIWNLAPSTERILIEEGMQVIVKAGYENGQFGTIFKGTIFQPIRYREDYVDEVLLLHCIDGMGLISNNHVSTSLAAGSKPEDRLHAVADNATNPIPIQYITPGLDVKQLPRGKVFFGEPKKYIRNLAQDSNAQWFINDGELYVGRIQDDPTPEKTALVISPENGLIGSPEQIQDGVSFRTLLNPTLKIAFPAMWVKLDMTQIRMFKKQYGQLSTALDEDGFYRIASVIHTGDTRGNEWYTDCVGVTFMGNRAAMLETPDQSPN